MLPLRLLTGALKIKKKNFPGIQYYRRYQIMAHSRCDTGKPPSLFLFFKSGREKLTSRIPQSLDSDTAACCADAVPAPHPHQTP